MACSSVSGVSGRCASASSACSKQRPPPGGRARERLGAGLAEIGHGLVPHLAPEGVVGQPLDLLGEPVGVESLDRLDDPRVEAAPALLEQAAVGHLVGQGVLEGVLELRERGASRRGTRRPGGARAPVGAARRASSAMAWSSANGHVLADDGGGLEQPLLLRAAAGRCAPPGPPGPWPAPGWRRRARSGDRRRAPRRGPPSRPASARSPRGRTGCPRSARSGGASAARGRVGRRAARRAAPRRSPAAAGRAGAGCSSVLLPQPCWYSGR